MFNKLFYLMLFCTFAASTITRKAFIYICNTISETITCTPNAISNWIKNHAFATPKNDARQVMVVENFLEISLCKQKFVV